MLYSWGDIMDNLEKALELACKWINNRVDYSNDGCRICPLYRCCNYSQNNNETCDSRIQNYFMNLGLNN